MLLTTIHLAGLSTLHVIHALSAFSKVFGVVGSVICIRMALGLHKNLDLLCLVFIEAVS